MAQTLKNPPAIQETWVQYMGWEDALENGMAMHSTTPVFWPGEFHGQRGLADYSPWSHKELDMTEGLTHTHTHTQTHTHTHIHTHISLRIPSLLFSTWYLSRIPTNDL